MKEEIEATAKSEDSHSARCERYHEIDLALNKEELQKKLSESQAEFSAVVIMRKKLNPMSGNVLAGCRQISVHIAQGAAHQQKPFKQHCSL